MAVELVSTSKVGGMNLNAADEHAEAAVEVTMEEAYDGLLKLDPRTKSCAVASDSKLALARHLEDNRMAQHSRGSCQRVDADALNMMLMYLLGVKQGEMEPDFVSVERAHASMVKLVRASKDVVDVLDP